MIPATDILEDVALGPRTTLELGGPAAFYLRARDDRSVAQGLQWAKRRGVRAAILGGGSNLVVADGGFDGLVIEMAQQGIEEREDGTLIVQAGEDWDQLVERCVAAGLAGIECLAGIPGRVGATPIQNVGAYGQDVAETITAVRVLDRDSLQQRTLTPEECEFAYRDSMFKRNPERYVVLEVRFRLTPEGPPALRYAELQRALEGRDPSLSDVRDMVLGLRRRKSMVLDFADPNHRSAGSFFTNPIVAPEVAAGIEDAPQWPMPDGRVKLAAGWLIEQAGFPKGTRRGPVGLSSVHALALVNHGEGTTTELLAFAEEVRAGVEDRFGVLLEREPRLLV